MAVLPSEFSEFAFGNTVTTQLVNCRMGAMSPWPARSISRQRVSHVILHQELTKRGYVEREIIELVLMNDFDLTEKQARAITDAYGAPFIPTQSLEKAFPVDLAMNSRGVYFFLQFKRSTAVTAKRWDLTELKEIEDKKINLPLYRVYIGGGQTSKNKKSAGREQWENLGELEDKLKPVKSAFVGYAAPAFHELSELTEFHNNGLFVDIDGRSPVVCFKARNFDIPDNKRHCISFDGTDNEIGWCYSSDPDKVSEVVSLAKMFGERVQGAPILSKSIGNLRVLLDEFAEDMELDDRELDDDDVSKKLSTKQLLDIFGISIAREDEAIQPQNIESRRAMEFMRSTSMVDVQESDLDGAIRKIMEHGEDGQDRSRMSFLQDFYHADYRCRQILGQPLMIYAKPDPTALPDE